MATATFKDSDQRGASYKLSDGWKQWPFRKRRYNISLTIINQKITPFHDFTTRERCIQFDILAVEVPLSASSMSWGMIIYLK